MPADSFTGEMLLVLGLEVVLIAAFRLAVVIGAGKGSGGRVVVSRCVGSWHVVRAVAFAAVLAGLLVSGGPGLPVLLAGTGICVLAIWLRRASFTALGHFYSVHVEVFDEHMLVDEGPYRFVRHPLYVSYCAFLAGLAVVSGAWTAGVFVAVVVIPFIAAKACREERELLARLGDEYRRYRERVPALVPMLRPRTGEPSGS